MTKRIFIIPYRDRLSDKERFLSEMKTLLADTEPYEIYFAHQYDQRPFNRGAMKNIGFLAMKAKYPEEYKEMTLLVLHARLMGFNVSSLGKIVSPINSHCAMI